MPEAKKTNILIEKTILALKTLYNGVRIHRIWNWESHYLQSIQELRKKTIHRIFKKYIEYIFQILEDTF